MSERDYQLQARQSINEIFKTEQSALAVMATGLGKTHVIAHTIDDTPGRAFVMAHRTELIEQAANKIEAITGLERGIDIQIEKAEQYASRMFPAKVVVGSVQTMSRGRYKDFDPFQYNLFVLDECIHGMSRIQMTDGTTMTIKQIHDDGVRASVLSYNIEFGQVESKMVVGKKQSQTSSTYHICCGDDSEIVCTPEHKIYTNRGYILAKDLKLNDLVLKCCYENTHMGPASLRKSSWGWQHTKNQERIESTIEVSPQHETVRPVNGKVRQVEAVCRNTSKGGSERGMGWANNIIRNLNPSRVLRSVVDMHQRLQEGPEPAVAREGYRRGFSVVVHGRWVQAKSWCESMYRRFFLPGTFCYSGMVLLPLGNRGQNATRQAGSMDDAVYQRSSIQTVQNDRALYGPVCRLQTVQARGGEVRSLQRRFSPSPRFWEANLLQQTGLPNCSGNTQRPKVLSEEQGCYIEAEPRSGIGCKGRENVRCLWGYVSDKQECSSVVQKPRMQDQTQETEIQGLVSCKQGTRIEETKIVSIREVKENIDVYDLEVEGNHNYFANGILVSNCHHGVSKTNRMVIEHFAQNPNCKILGVSVGPKSILELKGGCYGEGFVGTIEDAYRIAGDAGVTPEEWNGFQIYRFTEVLSRGWDGAKFCWKPCNKILRHIGDKPCRSIVANGVSTVVTDDHSIYRAVAGGNVRVKQGDSYQSKQRAEIDCPVSQELQIDDTLLYDDGFEWQTSDTESAIDMVDFADKHMKTSYITIGCDVKSIHRQRLRDIGANPKQIYQWREKGRLPIGMFLGLADHAPIAKTVGMEASASTISANIRLSDWAYVLGFYLGNGWLCSGEKTYEIGFSVKTKDVDMVCGRLENLEGVTWNVRSSKKRGCTEFNMNSRFVYEIIKSVFGKKRAHEKRIPSECILSWNKSSRRELLNGLMASDGHIQAAERNRKSCHYVTTSTALTETLMSLLRSLGVKGSVSKRKTLSGGIVKGRQINAKHAAYSVKWSMHQLDGNDNGHFGSRSRYAKQGISFLESQIRDIRQVDTPEYVYDLEMFGHPSFVADGILVHNTATPDRADEKSLGMVFKNVAMDYGTVDGIRDGWLVPIEQNEVFVEGLDFSACKTSMGDLANNEVAAIMEFEQNLHEVASSTIQIVGDRKTLVFTASVVQAERMSEIFNRHKDGCADFVTGKTPTDVRANMFKNYARGGFQYLVGVGVMTEGFDDPGVEVVVMARPTKSRSLYAQMAGRSLRPSSEIAYQLNECETAEERRSMIAQSMKSSALIIDFVGNSGKHKLVNSADILGGKYDDEVVELAKAEVTRKSKTGESVEIMSELHKAEQELAMRGKEAIDAAKRSGLKLKATFALKGVDPFSVLGIVPTRIPGWDTGREASEKQIAYLDKMNIDAAGMNMKHASQLISAIVEKQKGTCQMGSDAGKPWTEVSLGKRKWFLRQPWMNLPSKERVRAEIMESLKAS